MPSYKVKTPLKRSDGVVEPGETVDLTAKAAAELIACGAIEELPPRAEDGNETDVDGKPKGGKRR